MDDWSYLDTDVVSGCFDLISFLWMIDFVVVDRAVVAAGMDTWPHRVRSRIWFGDLVMLLACQSRISVDIP